MSVKLESTSIYSSWIICVFSSCCLQNLKTSPQSSTPPHLLYNLTLSLYDWRTIMGGKQVNKGQKIDPDREKSMHALMSVRPRFRIKSFKIFSMEKLTN